MTDQTKINLDFFNLSDETNQRSEYVLRKTLISTFSDRFEHKLPPPGNSNLPKSSCANFPVTKSSCNDKYLVTRLN